jgi:chaperonin GroES
MRNNGGLGLLDLQVGDQGFFGKYSGTEVKVQSNELFALGEDDVIGVYEQ